MNIRKGFTLIELIILVVIISILAAIAISIYRTYISKSQVSSGLAEIVSVRNGYDVKVSEGEAITGLAQIGLSSISSIRCSELSITSFLISGAATNAIVCKLIGTSMISGKYIALNRLTSGGRICVTNIDASLRPKECIVGAPSTGTITKL